MAMSWRSITTVAVAILLFYALYNKGDVKAAFKTPLLEFSLDAKDKSAGK